jgi:RHH-type proline utilization regulon transcriptional repressor/proline dehydrogenase/delta 1-pyrroline-5-carboxylate dehydrogenase
LRFIARGRALCTATDDDELLRQIAAALATGNRVLACTPGGAAIVAQLPEPARQRVTVVDDLPVGECDVALCSPAQATATRRALADGDGPRVRAVTPEAADGGYPLDALVAEQTLSVNTAAAGGNASLMTLAPA